MKKIIALAALSLFSSASLACHIDASQISSGPIQAGGDMYGSILFDVEQNRVASTADRDHSQGRYALNNHPPMSDSRFSNDSDMYGTVLFDVDKPGVETVAQLDRRGDRRNNHPTMKFSNVC